MPRVLVADADAIVCDVHCRLLSHYGFEVEMALGGLECWASLQQASPDVLILDWDLPWGGGDGVLAAMRDAHLRIPVLLTSVMASPETLLRLAAPPVVMALARPYSFAALHEALCGILPRQLPEHRHLAGWGSHAADPLLGRSSRPHPSSYALLPPKAEVEPHEGEKDVAQATARIRRWSPTLLDLEEQVSRALCETGYPSLRAVQVQAQGARVTLQGRVPSYYLKQLAQAAALAVPGVLELHIDLEVSPPRG